MIPVFLFFIYYYKVYIYYIEYEVEKMKYNIVDSATYLVKKFHDDYRDLLEIKLQKMLYFAEAYYMVIYGTNSLFREEWLAKPYGPMNSEVHELFKNAGLPIDMRKVNFEKADRTNSKLRKFLDAIYEMYKDTPAAQLVELTHSDSSPWSEVSSNMTGVDLLNNTTEIVPKDKTKEWIKKCCNN